MRAYKQLAQCLQVPEFQDLPASSIESLAHVLTEKAYPPKGVIYYQGNEVEDIFFVQQGHVKVAFWSATCVAHLGMPLHLLHPIGCVVHGLALLCCVMLFQARC